MRTLTTFILIGLLGFSSCKNEFLDLAPETYLSSSTFFKNADEVDQALLGAYSSLRGMIRPGFYMDEMRSDNTFFTYYAPDRGPANWVEDIILFMDHSQTTLTTDRYRNNFTGISRVNAILSRIDGVEMSEESRNRILGEAGFLRAFFYFDLVQHYGGVPLHLEEVTSEAGAFLPRSTAEEVYAQIIADLENAIPKLPAADVFPQSGRASKGAAKLLLAYVYMSKPSREYAKAEKELLDITNMNYELEDNYADIYLPSNKNNRESIFEIQFKAGNDGQQSDWIYTFIPKTANSEVITGIPVNTINSGGWNVPTQELIDSYEAGDERLNASVGVVEGTQSGDSFTYEEMKEIVGYTPSPGKQYYYFIKKFLHPPYDQPFNTDDNWPVYRYADALLLLAECLVEQNRNGEALPYLNQVRERAGLTPLSQATAENIALERQHELAFENHRWTDLIRTGKAVEVMTAHGQKMKAQHPFIPARAYQVTQEKTIYPIPYREMQLNDLLEQNPGYDF